MKESQMKVVKKIKFKGKKDENYYYDYYYY